MSSNNEIVPERARRLDFSVLTPTWERAEYLEGLWHSLRLQSGCSFEWIVGNDGSTDGTAARVESLALNSGFPVVLVNAEKHIGKARIDNLMVAAANSELCVWCDAGDTLKPMALSSLHGAWREIKSEDMENYVGVAALAESEGGLGNAVESHEVSWNLTLRQIEDLVASDMVLAVRTDVLRSMPFPEVDMVIPESSVWSKLGEALVGFVPVALKIVNYGQPNAVSGSGRMAYSRGRAHAMGLQRKHALRPVGAMEECREMFNFVRYCLHGEIAWADAKVLWGASVSRLFLTVVYLPALVASWIDRARGKVDKTHREFERTRDFRFSIVRWNNDPRFNGNQNDVYDSTSKAEDIRRRSEIQRLSL